jgi:hypothetical protein
MKLTSILGLVLHIISFGCVISVTVKTYHLNKYVPYNESFSSSDSEQECLYARGNFSIKPTHSVCYRYNARSYAGLSYPYNIDLLQFGQLKAVYQTLQRGTCGETGPQVKPPQTIGLYFQSGGHQPMLGQDSLLLMRTLTEIFGSINVLHCIFQLES